MLALGDDSTLQRPTARARAIQGFSLEVQHSPHDLQRQAYEKRQDDRTQHAGQCSRPPWPSANGLNILPLRPQRIQRPRSSAISFNSC